MNAIRSTQALNKRELENAVPPEASWHTDYRDTAYIYIGGLPFDLSEGDVVTIFSQYGEPTHINLVRDRETGKSKGFAFLKYEDQRSTDLAVDNLGGATVLGRMLRVDHTRYKKREKRDGEESEEEDNVKTWKKPKLEEGGRSKHRDEEPQRPLLKEERELAELMRDHDEEDPMKDYLIQEKREEIEKALVKLEGKRHRHHHHRRHKHKEEQSDDQQDQEQRQRRHHRSRRGDEDGRYREDSRHRRRSPQRRSSRDSRSEKGDDDGSSKKSTRHLESSNPLGRNPERRGRDTGSSSRQRHYGRERRDYRSRSRDRRP